MRQSPQAAAILPVRPCGSAPPAVPAARPRRTPVARPIDTLVEPTDFLRQFLVAPHPVAVAAALAFGLFWGRAGAPLLLGRPGVWFGLLLGVLAYPFAQIWLRDEVTRAVLEIVADNIGAAAMRSEVSLVGLISAIVAAYADEFAKLIMLLVVAFVMARPSSPRAVTAAVIAPTAGYALFAAQLTLTQALQADLPSADLAFVFVREWAWVALQFGTAYMLARGWLAGRLAAYLLLAGVLHTAAAYTATLDDLGWHPAVVTLVLAVAGLLAFSWGASLIPAARR